LLAVVGVLATGLLGLGAAAIWQAHEAARQRTVDQMLGTARAFALLVDQEFARAEAILQAIAAHPAIAEGDIAAFLDVAGRLGRTVDGLVMAMAVAPGRQIANTLQGALPTPVAMPAGLEEVFRTGRTVLSDSYRGSVTGRPSVSVTVAVPTGDGGPPRYALGLTMNRGQLSGALSRHGLPDGAVATVLDRAGIVVAVTGQEEAGIGRLADAPLRAALALGDDDIVQHARMPDGQVSAIAFARAPAARYAVAIAMPQAAFARERNAALTRLGLMALPVALAALAAALLLALRLREALAGLSHGGAGPRLAEVEELAAALAAADAARAESEAALRDRTAWLEQTQRAAAVGVWDFDLARRELRWSETMWRLYGLDPARDGPATEATFRARVVPEDRPMVDAALAEALASGAYGLEFRIRRASDGALRWIRAQGVMERDAPGAPARLLGANLDITERRALEEEREALLAQKDLLVAEMHHRVKNSLQLVQGLLLLQARGAEPDLGARLREAAGRIVSIAAVHRRLYEGAPGPMQDAGRPPGEPRRGAPAVARLDRAAGRAGCLLRRAPAARTDGGARPARDGAGDQRAEARRRHRDRPAAPRRPARGGRPTPRRRSCRSRTRAPDSRRASIRRARRASGCGWRSPWRGSCAAR
jgi:PAS domain-containing protein